jgi:hemerythrin
MFQFTEDCVTGISQIDDEHRALFEMINRGQALMDAGEKGAKETRTLLLELKKYAETHFAHEEAYMEEIREPELPRQRKEHEDFKKQVNEMLRRADEGDEKVLREILEFLSRWLYRHILGSDMMIGHMLKVTRDKEKTGEKRDPFAFTDQYRTGIELVDSEHEVLFQIIKEANDLIFEQLLHDKYDEIVRILGKLMDYTIRHFRDEEAYMERIGYDGLEAQKNAHQAFVDKLMSIDLNDVDDNQQEYLIELVDFLLSWLVNHIMKVDKKIPVRND